MLIINIKTPNSNSIEPNALSKSFMEYHKAGQCVGMPRALANHLRGIDLD
jgi:hypothetical protein